MHDTSAHDARAAAASPVSAGPWPGREGWPEVGEQPFGLPRIVLRSSRALGWYIGSGMSLLWLVALGQEMLTKAATTGSGVAAMAILVVYGAAFVVIAPVGWGLSAHRRLLLVVAFFALSFALLPWLGWQLAGAWTYVGVALGVMVLSWQVTFGGIALLGALAAWCEFSAGDLARGGYDVPAIIVSLSLMMAMFARANATSNQLRAAQRQVEAMAIERERGRMARDIHDILGHSLTVITVKAELAGRLADVDANRAKSEVADIERLARAALNDVRTTVAGQRGVTLSGELTAARTALAAADIAAEVPGAADAVGPEHRELAAWVVREGVTNVVRHSHATYCRVMLTAEEITVDDDGVGPSAPDGASTGLGGLRERVSSAGGTMQTGRSVLGGFRLQVTL